MSYMANQYLITLLMMNSERTNQGHSVLSEVCFVNVVTKSYLKTHTGCHIWPISLL